MTNKKQTMPAQPGEQSGLAAPACSAYTVKDSTTYTVGNVIRIWKDNGYRVWKVTAVCYGSIQSESVICLRSLDTKQGCNQDGKTHEYSMPLDLLNSNPNVERV